MLVGTPVEEPGVLVGAPVDGPGVLVPSASCVELVPSAVNPVDWVDDWPMVVVNICVTVVICAVVVTPGDVSHVHVQTGGVVGG